MIDPNQLSALEQQYGLPNGLLSAVQQQESGGNSNAVSPKGALGSFQFMPATAQAYGIDPTDPLQAANGAARMFGDLSKQYGGDVPSMLAAYNWGSGNLSKYGMQAAPPETQNYVKSITSKLGNPQYAQADTGTQSDAKVDDTVDVELPDGTIVQGVPPGITQQQLQKMIGVSAKPTFGQKVGADLEKRLGQVTNSLLSEYAGNQSTPETALQILGKGEAGSALDTMGNAISAATPQIAKDALSSAAQWLKSTDVGGALANFGSQAQNAYGQFQQSNPRAAANIESVANLAALPSALGASGTAASAGGKTLETAGNAIEKSATTSASKNKADFVKDLILPKDTAAVKTDQFGRSTESGILRNRQVQLSPQEQAIAASVAQVPGVSKSKSLLGNYNAIEDAKNTESQSLVDKLKKNDVAIPDDVIVNSLSAVRSNLAKNPYIVGDGAKAAEGVINNALDIISQNPQTASGLLQSRKDLDRLIASQRGEKAFNPTLEAPITNSIQEVRQAINTMVAQAVPEADVIESLRHQSNLYRALDNIRSKGAQEGKNRVTRAIQSVAPKSLAAKGVLGALGLGATYVAAPYVAGGLAAYGAQKAIRSPELYKAIGSALSKTGKLAQM